MEDIGPISGVVNAGAVTQRGNLMTTTASEFDMQMATNVRAPFLVTQAAAKHMIERGIRGSIVNICSVAAHGGAPFIMAYCASKAALVTLTKNNAAELAPKGIRVNGINMGWCYTENEDKLQSASKGPGWIKEADKGVPLGKFPLPLPLCQYIYIYIYIFLWAYVKCLSVSYSFPLSIDIQNHASY